MKRCKICNRAINEGEMGEVCRHKQGEETKIILNYMNQIDQIEKKFEVKDMCEYNEDKLDNLLEKNEPVNNGSYMRLFQNSHRPDLKSAAGMYLTVEPLLYDLENQGMIRHSSVASLGGWKNIFKDGSIRDFLILLIRKNQKN